MNTRKTGNEKETLVIQYLVKNSIRVIERNFSCKQGEIDIIGYDGNCLVFFEVKYRKSKTYGSALEAVNFGKQKKICKVADFYRYIHHIDENHQVRYDVIGVENNEIIWIKIAFEHFY